MGVVQAAARGSIGRRFALAVSGAFAPSTPNSSNLP